MIVRWPWRLAWLAPLLVGLLAGCGRPQTFNGTPYDPPLPAPEIVGVNWDGSQFHMSDQKGKVVLLFFGYTSCPDICPLTLAEMKKVHAQVGDQQDKLAVVFVSVDPERDTPERMATYVQAFNPAFYGVHVETDELEAVKKGYGVYAEKRMLTEEESAVGYLVDHTGWIYAIGPDGNLRLVFPHDTPADQIAPDVLRLIRS